MFTFQAAGLTDARLVNAPWVLETRSGTGWSTIAHGVVGTDLSLSLQLPLSTVLPTVGDGFLLVIGQPLDSTHMLLGIGTEARAVDRIQDLGNTITFHPVVQVAAAREHPLGTPAVPLDETAQNDANGASTQAQYTASPPGSSSTQQPAATAPSPPDPLTIPGTDAYLYINGGGCIYEAERNIPADCTPTAGDIPTFDGPGQNPFEALPIPTTPNPPQVGIPSNGTCIVTGCDATTAGSSAPTPEDNGTCSGNTSWWTGDSQNDCVDYSSQNNIDSFRGWSNKVPGDAVQPAENYTYTETWDWGTRVQAGPFSVSGGKDSEYTSGGTINFKFRGDCWSPSQPGDNCTSSGGMGWWSHWGQDLWRWERHTVDQCNTGDCWSSDYEIVFDAANNGGNDTSEQNDHSGEGERPIDAKNGTWGAAAHWNTDSGTQTKYLQSSTKYSFGADFELSWDKAFGGSASFKAGATNTTVQTFYNQITLRGPNTGLPWMGGWYDYDGNYTPHWQWDFWTCYYRSGWTGGAVSQDEAITPQYPCWDYTAAGSPPLS